ncbi:MAG: PilN domain-containing protein [Pseudomonadota bacterium]
MPQINLLPWREELRKERQKVFMFSVVGAIAVAGLLVGAVNMVFSNMIDHQRDRNRLLNQEISKLNESIKGIEGIERQKQRLIARMQVIEELQQSRPEIVHLFDELTRTVPDGVHLNRVTQSGRSVKLTGVAQSSTRVSSYMRNVNDSDWLGNPDLDKIETVDRGQRRERFNFTLDASQLVQSNEDEEIGQ